MARWGRRSLLIIGFVLVGILFAVCTLVPPRHAVAVVAVSRFGDRISLLPESVSLSFLPMSRRMMVPRLHGHAAIETSLDARTGGDTITAIPIRIELDGNGPLPISDAAPRAGEPRGTIPIVASSSAAAYGRRVVITIV